MHAINAIYYSSQGQYYTVYSYFMCCQNPFNNYMAVYPLSMLCIHVRLLATVCKHVFCANCLPTVLSMELYLWTLNYADLYDVTRGIFLLIFVCV